MARVSTNIRIVQSGMTGDTFIRTIEKSFAKPVLYRDLEKVKREVLDETESFINDSRKRNKERHDETWRTSRENNLINTLKTGSFIEATRGNRLRLGIGNLDFLDRNSPYWYKVNYGGRINMRGRGVLIKKGRFAGKYGILGHFGRTSAPGFATEETFKAWTNPKFLMIPQNPIPPMRYLNQMAKRFDINIAALDVDYRKRLKARLAVV